jgi:hypothetical protein
VTIDNIATITFNEVVKITDFEGLKTDLQANIIGPSSPYTFEYAIYDTSNNLKTGVEITQFNVRIFNIKAPIYGDGIEKIEFWLSDPTLIKDLAGNALADGKMTGNLKKFEYISESKQNSYILGEKATAESGGQSMKYTLLTMFSVNLLLKLVISSSAATMWSLIHVLQVFRYILMINVDMPVTIQILMQYLAVVVGEVNEVEDLIPDLFNTYIIDGEALNSSVTLYPKFEENGKILHLFFRL